MNNELFAAEKKTAALPGDGDIAESNNGDLSKVRVSCFANAEGTQPEGTGATLAQIAADIRGEGTRGQKLAKDTATVRRFLAEANMDKRDPKVDAAKKALPGITASGRFTYRAKKNLTHHTGVIQADFDHVPDIPKLKAWLAADPHVVLIYTSPTATGVKTLFRVQPPDTDDIEVLTAWHEGNAFPALTNYCQRAFGFRIDQKVVVVSMLCFLGHDPDVHTNWNAEPLDVEAWLNPVGAKGDLNQLLDRAKAKGNSFLGTGAKFDSGQNLHKLAKVKADSHLTTTPVIRTHDDTNRAKALAKSANRERFCQWATDCGFTGDLRTLDLRTLLANAGLTDKPTDDDKDDDKVFVQCPWEDQHTTRGNGTDVVVFRDPDTKGFPFTFHCSHDHCSDKDVMSLLEWCEDRTPGCVDEACAKTYEPEATDPSFNDAGRADRFVARYGRDLRFVPQREVWLTWERDRWRLDGDGAVERFALAMSKAMLVAAADIKGTDDASVRARNAAVKEALACGDRRNIADFVHLARVNPLVLLAVDKLDADPWVVGAKNLVVDLRTGAARPYTRADFITRTLACDVDLNATCPRWDKCMEEVFPDEDVRHYVHKAVGYSLTGAMREHVFFFLYGNGRNGKSTFVKTLEKHVLGKLCVRAGKGITTASENGKYPEREVAELAGARTILSSETEIGQKLNEGVIKDLSGGDVMRGRHLYEGGFDFAPVGKLWVMGNHKPAIKGTDGGIWRRVRLIPFTQKFEGDKDDRQMEDKLAAEASGILNWAVRGCLLWQREGLEMPDAMRAAVNLYKRDEDKLADFIEDVTFDNPSGEILNTVLYERYKQHCEENGAHPWSSKLLGKALRERMWQDHKRTKGVVWLGVSLRTVNGGGDEGGGDPF
jgi:P4 family phage/plasmid primase-like protien